MSAQLDLDDAAASSQLAQRELAALRADAARLDWLADRDNSIGNVQLPTVCVMNNLGSLRDAIDEAMRLDPTIWDELGGADAAENFSAA